uniref:phosphogluconate dehydrogenase (NADP(+)-dependent, decarboxylating) n=1 Tax=Aegilops tauschii subsp. strangulata TaxID=200361 RepID=A0A453QEI7_AEGTS
MNIIKAKSTENRRGLNLGELARIWKGGCIIRASFLDRIKKAYDRNGELANLLIDLEFAQEIMDREATWRRVVWSASPSATGGTGFPQTLSRPRGTTSGRTPTRGSTCPAPSTPSGTRSPTQR